jgi:hypothetical protein
MAIRKIAVPDPVQLVDLDSGKPVGERVSFSEFVDKALMRENRVWIMSYSSICSAMAISRALVTPYEGCVMLSEDDWKLLAMACENPRRINALGQDDVGFANWVPKVFPQFVPFLKAILEATIA